jgi:LPXTG-site transpeptidase (sortase) family protein
MDVRRPRPNLDNPAFRGRLRGPRHAVLHGHSHSEFSSRMSDVRVEAVSNKPEPKQNLVDGTNLVSVASDIKHARGRTFDFESHKPSAPGNKLDTHHLSTLSSWESVMKKPTISSPSVPYATENLSKPITTKHHDIKKIKRRALHSKVHLPKQNRSNVLSRQAVKPLVYTSAKKHRRPLVPTLLSGIAVFLFMAGLLLLFTTLRTNNTVKAQVKQLAQKTEDDNGISEGTPSEDNPPNLAGNSSYQVSPDMPRLLTIGKIDVNARIRRIGVGPNNILNAPANIFDVGWYDGSAKPGEGGTIVIDGHVSGPTKHGVFYSLGTLKAGDKISIERGDGKKYTYSVTGTQLFENNKVDMSKVMTSSVAGKPGLNLITCAGRFNVRTNQFEQRVVVYAVQD